jgi:hypothetical protein
MISNRVITAGTAMICMNCTSPESPRTLEAKFAATSSRIAPISNDICDGRVERRCRRTNYLPRWQPIHLR